MACVSSCCGLSGWCAGLRFLAAPEGLDDAHLSKVHAANEWPNPCQCEIVRATIRGIKRIKGTAQDQAKPLLREDLFLVLDAMGDTPRDHRDRALNLRRSKTDQTGQGRKIGIPLGRTRHCPVAALTAWRDVLADDIRPLFRPVDRHGNISTDRIRSDAVSTILRDRVRRAGIAPDGYSGHSLRAGLATSAIKAGVPTYKVRAQTGHASDAMRSRYVRDGDMFVGNAAGVLL